MWLSIFVFLPILGLFVFFGRRLLKYWRVIGLSIIGALIFSVPWDIISVKEHIWYFEEPYIVGWWYAGLPLEEYLFIIFVTALFAMVSVLAWERYGHTV
jgi:lycopene cyclase domain-containing protein